VIANPNHGRGDARLQEAALLPGVNASCRRGRLGLSKPPFIGEPMDLGGPTTQVSVIEEIPVAAQRSHHCALVDAHVGVPDAVAPTTDSRG